VFFYWGHRQYDEALAEFNRSWSCNLTTPQRANFADGSIAAAALERSITDVRRAQGTRPRDAQIPANLGATYAMLRQWKDAEQVIKRSFIDPHNVIAASILAMARLGGPGNVDSALRALMGSQWVTLVGPNHFRRCLPLSSDAGLSYVIERRFSEAFQSFEQEGNYSGLGICSKCRARCPSRAGRTD